MKCVPWCYRIFYCNIDHGIYNQWSKRFSACFALACVNIQLIRISIRCTETPELVTKWHRFSANEHLTAAPSIIQEHWFVSRKPFMKYSILYSDWSKVALSLTSYCIHLMCCYPRNEFLILWTGSVSYSRL